ncbi:hypothetical protein QBC34DRAFT_117583 [Podospora aff. communis PSN243]|uniref:Uncharacterized protein n=1 Tax=Podospora aff. communis PSN243 TaxID=3040156 RepID=A0AAV9GJF8_9PEZI|nr:hypothetical protein QBC34DRAFT_117583 [Podospora aff. communis PSN243]
MLLVPRMCLPGWTLARHWHWAGGGLFSEPANLGLPQPPEASIALPQLVAAHLLTTTPPRAGQWRRAWQLRRAQPLPRIQPQRQVIGIPQRWDGRASPGWHLSTGCPPAGILTVAAANVCSSRTMTCPSGLEASGGSPRAACA